MKGFFLLCCVLFAPLAVVLSSVKAEETPDPTISDCFAYVEDKMREEAANNRDEDGDEGGIISYGNEDDILHGDAENADDIIKNTPWLPVEAENANEHAIDMDEVDVSVNPYSGAGTTPSVTIDYNAADLINRQHAGDDAMAKACREKYQISY